MFAHRNPTSLVVYCSASIKRRSAARCISTSPGPSTSNSEGPAFPMLESLSGARGGEKAKGTRGERCTVLADALRGTISMNLTF